MITAPVQCLRQPFDASGNIPSRIKDGLSNGTGCLGCAAVLAVPGCLLLWIELLLAAADWRGTYLWESFPAAAALLLPAAMVALIGVALRSDNAALTREEALRRNAMTNDRFTQQAQGVLASAAIEAERRAHPYVGTEHLLLALLEQRDGTAVTVLRTLGDAGLLRASLEATMRTDDTPRASAGVSGYVPRGYTSRAMKVLQMSVEEAQRFQMERGGPEHILLALCADEQGLAGKVLRDAGLTRAVVSSYIGRQPLAVSHGVPMSNPEPTVQPSSRTELATYSTNFEAETSRLTLADAGIPVLVKGDLTGGFGPGFQGTIPGGVTLCVPSAARAQAREMLGLDDDGVA